MSRRSTRRKITRRKACDTPSSHRQRRAMGGKCGGQSKGWALQKHTQRHRIQRSAIVLRLMLIGFAVSIAR